MRGLRLHETFRSRELRRNQTSAEARLWQKLRGRRLGHFKFARQEPIGPFFVDFVCRERALVVELDGATHSTDEELTRDARRTQLLKEKGYRVLRVTNDEAFKNIDGVCDTILAALNERTIS